MKQLEPHQLRVVNEKEELDGRIERLRQFFKTDVFAELDTAERDRLTQQVQHMRNYSSVLGERIHAFAI